MALTTLDPHTALVLIDLQNGIVGAPTAPHAGPEVVTRAVRPGRRLPRAGPARGAGPGHRCRRRGRRRTRPDRDAAPGGRRPEGWDVIVDELTGHAATSS